MNETWDPLENDKDLQNRSLHFAAYKKFIWWFFSIWAKGIDKLSLPVYYGQLENFFQRLMDSKYTWFKEGERDWLDAYTIYKT